MITVGASAVMFGAERDRGRVWGLLADAMRAGVGCFDGLL